MAVKEISVFLLTISWFSLVSDADPKPDQTPNADAAIDCYQCHTQDVTVDCVTKAPPSKPCEMLHKYCIVLVIKDREEGLISLTRDCSPVHMGNGCFPVDEAETRLRCFFTCKKNSCNGPGEALPFYMHAAASQKDWQPLLYLAAALLFTLSLLLHHLNIPVL